MTHTLEPTGETTPQAEPVDEITPQVESAEATASQALPPECDPLSYFNWQTHTWEHKLETKD